MFVSPQKRMMNRMQMVIPWTVSHTGIVLAWQLGMLSTPNTAMMIPNTKHPSRKRNMVQYTAEKVSSSRGIFSWLELCLCWRGCLARVSGAPRVRPQTWLSQNL